MNFEEYGINPADITPGVPRNPFNQDAADILATFKPAVVSFHFGLPEPAPVEQVKSWGAIVLSSATTVAEAIWLEENGADAIIAQGA